MRIFTPVFLVSWLSLATAPVGALQRYEAHYEQSEWIVTHHAARCEARHVIPRFGEVAFVQTAGSDLAFRVEAYHRPPETQAVEVRTETPEWRGGDELEELGALPMEPEAPTVYVSQGAALMLLFELESGRMPVLAYRDWTRPERSIEVAVSPIRFLPAVTSFRECVAELPPPPIAVARIAPEEPEAEPTGGGAVDAGGPADPEAAAAERRRKLKYRILSGGSSEEVRILLPEEAASAQGTTPDGDAPADVSTGPAAPPAE